jgi:hypothetical protein
MRSRESYGFFLLLRTTGIPILKQIRYLTDNHYVGSE